MHKKINILHLIPGLGVGGAEKVLFNICRLYDDSTFELTIAFWGKDTSLLNDIKNTSVNIIKLDFKNVISPSSIASIKNVLKRKQIDILQTHFIDADLLGFLATVGTAIPHFIDIHSYPFPIKWTHCLRYKLMSCFAERIICVSQTVKNLLMSKSRISPKKISVIYNGIDLKKHGPIKDVLSTNNLKKSLGIHNGSFVIGNVSRLIEDKGQKYLIEAFSEIFKNDKKAVLLIIGDGPLKEDLMTLAKSLNISERVIFTGTRNDIPALLNVMDIFVFPTFNEAMGVTVLEAMAAGLPIIASDDAAIVELIENEKEGLLVHPGDSTALNQVMRKMINDQEKAKVMGINALKKVKEFSDTIMVKSYENLYAGVVRT